MAFSTMFLKAVEGRNKLQLTRAQKDQGTPFSYSPFDPPSNKVPQIVEIIMLEYLRVPRNFLGLWPLRLRPSKLRLPGN